MIRRSLTTLSLLALAAAPLAAQGTDDPTHKVAGGALPAGWMGRTDRPTDKLTDAKFVAMGSGYHVTSGPAAIYWNPKTVTNGPFVASTTITQTKAPTHPEAYGIFFMGKDLDAPGQNYAYFIVRGDGKYLVNHRAGAEIHKIIPWTENAAVNKQDASGKVTNKLTVDASKADSVRLLVNDKQVAALPMNHLGKTDGLVGLRVNHNLDVHIGDLTVTPKK
ncbi:MAG TPA: hypothetical protein VJT85_02795 [Gemmatimonadaceae bacterium]|nr:hypothetical protein [Gemmatimonadaceae bacterium]